MATGKIKFFNDTKGFGFIAQDDGGKDLYAHSTGFIPEAFTSTSIAENLKVSYEVKNDGKEPRAINIRPI
ncbi:cold-shock protein [Pseudomonas sp. TH08]|uniref:cold-shock protein n=1 Tax=unclassified Pseudomonas TaxID=196821 RepID=UPI0019114037|nr:MULTISPECIES: cold-shock protein [unclassified Pseudomonas]MBK5529607.1 cold-shock protein [Pseudomonas sp. TH06]MBK5534711.1 cold-shock protein [Pseudomonas sp. TH08]